jgi:hypothetical protein
MAAVRCHHGATTKKNLILLSIEIIKYPRFSCICRRDYQADPGRVIWCLQVLDPLRNVEVAKATEERKEHG